MPEESIHEARKEMRLSYQEPRVQANNTPQLLVPDMYPGLANELSTGKLTVEIYMQPTSLLESLYSMITETRYNSSPVLDKHNINSSVEVVQALPGSPPGSTNHVL
jgi:hypothetical protein